MTKGYQNFQFLIY